MNHEQRLRKQIERQAQRMRRAEREQPTLLAQTAYLGTLGLLFVLPLVIGAYLGRWLDGLRPGYSVSWTVSLVVLGVFIGATNVYLFIRGRE